MRKMILTGALVLFGAGTTPQVVAALAVCIGWCTLIANVKPFGDDVDDRLAQVEALQVLFTLLTGLVLQLQAANRDGTQADDEALGIVLISLNCIVVALALVQQPIVHKVADRLCVQLYRRCKDLGASKDWAQPLDSETVECDVELVERSDSRSEAAAHAPGSVLSKPIGRDIEMADALQSKPNPMRDEAPAATADGDALTKGVPPVAAVLGLPVGWSAVVSSSGAPYYWNAATGVKQWELPSQPGGDSADTARVPARAAAMRRASDGAMYTRAQFVAHYGDAVKWRTSR